MECGGKGIAFPGDGLVGSVSGRIPGRDHESAAARLLLFDDDPMLLRSVSHALRTAGYEVEVAYSATQGLRLAEAMHPDSGCYWMWCCRTGAGWSYAGS